MKFFVSTGEASGDLHLSYLVKSIKQRYKNVKFYGVAGEKSQKEGVNIIQNIDELAIMGFTEILSKYNFLKQKAQEYLNFIKINKIENIILIDYGGFNLKFLEILKKELPNIKIFFYIPPKIWIWGEKRINKLKLADYIMVIFPWEVDFYKKHNINAIYFGNPFTDIYKKNKNYGDSILLLPGSRKQELQAILPIFLDVVEKSKNENFILKLNSHNDLKYIQKIQSYPNVSIKIDEELASISQESKLAIATSGTITLELSLLNLPTIVVYKTSFLNYFIAKYILKIKFISLPNLILDDEIFPELIQKNCNSDKIIKKISYIIKNSESIYNKIDKMRKKIEGISVIDSYADFLLEKANENF